MFYVYCWHRPGASIRGEIRRCRHCGVAVEECPGVAWRQACDLGAQCPACEGSGWVAIIRSKSAELAQMIGSEAATSAAGRSQLKD
jgi:hypothetical protein